MGWAFTRCGLRATPSPWDVQQGRRRARGVDAHVRDVALEAHDDALLLRRREEGAHAQRQALPDHLLDGARVVLVQM